MIPRVVEILLSIAGSLGVETDGDVFVGALEAQRMRSNHFEARCVLADF